MSNPVNPEIKTLCENRLNEITPTDTADLAEFAECRLVALGVPPSWGQDVTQKAFQLVLQGLETEQIGRRPCLEDLKDRLSFLNFLRGIISSLAHAMTVKSWFKAEQMLDDGAPIPDEAGRSPAQRAEFSDLRDQLFIRLRKRAQPCLRSTIDAWESVFDESDRIPTPVSRKNGHEVRSLAKKILTELDGIN